MAMPRSTKPLRPKTISRGKPKLIAILGPTASGKTALSIALAQRFGGEIVSADSRQVYRGMDIGTAKPPRAERCGIPHYLIDIKNPDEPYTLADYQQDAIAAIRKVVKNGGLPILVGGTGLYADAVTENLLIPHAAPNITLRKRLEARLAREGLAALFRELITQDPEAAYIVDPKNPRRVIRALEIIITTKMPFSAQRTQGEPLFHTLKIGIMSPKEKLKKRIDTRVDQMIKNGLVQEVKKLVTKYGAEQAAFDAIGYREVISYLEKKITLGEAVTLIKKNTWQYARRQMTWFRKDKNIAWITNKKQVNSMVSKFLRGS